MIVKGKFLVSKYTLFPVNVTQKSFVLENVYNFLKKI